MRDRLIELMKEIRNNPRVTCPKRDDPCDGCKYDLGDDCDVVGRVVDYIVSSIKIEQAHGEWKKVSEKYPRYVCTCCHHLYNNKGYKYCPNCGARMEVEE